MMSWCPTSSLNLMPWLLGRLPTNWRRDAEKREKLQNNRAAQSYPWTSLWHIDMKTNDSTRSSDDCEEWTKKDKHSLSNNLHKCKTARVRQYVYTVHWGNHLAFLLILCCTCVRLKVLLKSWWRQGPQNSDETNRRQQNHSLLNFVDLPGTRSSQETDHPTPCCCPFVIRNWAEFEKSSRTQFRRCWCIGIIGIEIEMIKC